MSLRSIIAQDNKVNKRVLDQVVTEMAYPSGFLPLDYLNGFRVVAYDENDRPIQQSDIIGLTAGSMTSVIGLSGVGKTALTAELAAAPLFVHGDRSYVDHADIEQSSTMQRILKTLKLPPSFLKETYEIYREKAAEEIVQRFKTHCEMKLANLKQFYYNTGVKNLYGDEIVDIVPSSMLLDSFAMFKSQKTDLMDAKNIEDINNNMKGAQDAKFNKAMLMQMLAYGKKANVSLYSINHINVDVNTGFLPKASQLPSGLNQGETMPGGQAALYLANNIIRLKQTKRYYPEKPDTWEFGMPGMLVEAKMSKSRTNITNRPVSLVFDHTIGRFSKTLTLLQFGIVSDVFEGSNRAMYIPGLESVKFTKKTFRDVVTRSPEIMEALYEACLPHLQAMLSTDIGALGKQETHDEKMDTILNIYQDMNADLHNMYSQGFKPF